MKTSPSSRGPWACGCSSIGKASTSVASSSAAPTARLKSPGTSERSISAAPGVSRAAATLRLAVGGDDALDQLVTDDVLAAEADEVDVLDPGEDVADLNEPRGRPPLEIDLRDVTRDDELRAKAESGEEHLHLLRAGVLGLVEDHERIVQRPPAHKGQRRDLNGAALEVRVDALRIQHVVERVEERAQVGVHLRLDVTGQEAEPLAGLDGGAGEDHAADVATR